MKDFDAEIDRLNKKRDAFHQEMKRRRECNSPAIEVPDYGIVITEPCDLVITDCHFIDTTDMRGTNDNLKKEVQLRPQGS